MKKYIIFMLLAVSFVFVFIVHIDKKLSGPHFFETINGLKIEKAYVDENNKTLIFIRADKWIAIDLFAALEENSAFAKYSIKPRGDNFFHWHDFQESAFIASEQLLEVFLFTEKSVGSFWTKANNRNALIQQIPDGYNYALMRAPSRYGEDPNIEFESYLLLGRKEIEDGKYGVQLFYHRDYIYSYRIALEPVIFIVFGPSYLAFGLMLFLFVNCPSKGTAIKRTAFSLVLHGITSLFLIVMKQMGDAWSGASNNGTAFLVAIAGAILILSIFAIVYRQAGVNK